MHAIWSENAVSEKKATRSVGGPSPQLRCITLIAIRTKCFSYFLFFSRSPTFLFQLSQHIDPEEGDCEAIETLCPFQPLGCQNGNKVSTYEGRRVD